MTMRCTTMHHHEHMVVTMIIVTMIVVIVTLALAQNLSRILRLASSACLLAAC
jgi:hypothetical protein